MRRQHQAVTLAAPGNMIAESTPVRDLAFFPLDRHIFIKLGHSGKSLRKCILFQPAKRTQGNPAHRMKVRSSENPSHHGTVFSLFIPHREQ
jgi:hypothetical protein